MNHASIPYFLISLSFVSIPYHSLVFRSVNIKLAINIKFDFNQMMLVKIAKRYCLTNLYLEVI